MLLKKIAVGDLLYHAVHGLCRTNRVSQETSSGKKVLSYSLTPKVTSKMKTRFIIEASQIEASGFHTLISAKEANKVLEYLKVGDSTAIQENPARHLAQIIWSCACEKFCPKDQRKRQMLERAAKGLVGELALVFDIPAKKAAERIRKSLGSVASINSSVLAALARASEN